MFLPVGAMVPDSVKEVADAKRAVKSLDPARAKAQAAQSADSKHRPSDLGRLGYLDPVRRMHTL